MITLQTTASGYGFQTQQSSSDRNVEAGKSTETKDGELSEMSLGKEVDSVSISDAALLARKHGLANASTQYYEQFMPTYEGFSAATIAEGISNPGVDAFSAGKSFDQVAIDARASLDNNYERLESIGKPYIAASAQSIDRNSLVGELDRRAQYAVASNEGGLFTKDEQLSASAKLTQQTSLAMGLYSGPTSEKEKFIDPFMGDNAQKFKAGMQFLDQVSKEEKAGSIEYAYQRASLQRSY